MKNADKVPITQDRDRSGIVIHSCLGTVSAFGRQLGLKIIDGFSFCAAADSFYTTPWRRFDFYSMSFLRHGRGLLQIRDQAEQIIEAGDIVLITPDCISRYGGAFHHVYEEETLLFSGEIADQLAAAGAISSGIYSGFSSGVFDEILALTRNPAHSKQIQGAYRLLAFLSDLFDKKNEQHSDAIDEVLKKLHRNPLKWWTVNELCDEVHLSPNHFRYLFEKKTGISPKHYIEEMKLKTAAHLLVQDQKLTVEDIAFRCGYQTPFHFASRFKLLFGVAPGQYRKQIMPRENQEKTDM